MAEKNTTTLSLSILFASLVISGSLIFFGFQINGGGGVDADSLKVAIEDGIEDYVQNAQAEAQAQAQGGSAAAEPERDYNGDYSDDDAILGDPNAPITIVEFSDYQCPFCMRFWSETLPEIKEKYIDTGQVKLVYRDYPLASHPQADEMAMMAECTRSLTDDAGYYAMHDAIFAAGGRYDEASLTQVAVDLGADANELANCMENREFEDEIYADLADGQALGITGTPGFIVGNQKISGAQPFRVFEEAIESQL